MVSVTTGETSPVVSGIVYCVVIDALGDALGDARATDMAGGGMVNVGQLVRERHADDVVLVGFAGHRGSVIAASS